MAQQITKTSICNQALKFLGETPLLVFPEESSNSDHCETFYESVKEGELIKFPWNFAIQREQLTQDATAPPFDYTYQHILPPNLLRILSVYPEGCEWKLEGQRILSYEGIMRIRYILNVDESQFHSLFATLISARLAMQLALLLTERQEKFQAAQLWYADTLENAKRADSLEGSIDQMDDLDVIRNRRLGFPGFRFRPVEIA